MLRKIIFSIIAFTSLQAWATEVSINKTEFTDRIFKGTIAEKYPITIYLSYANDAPDHRFTHSVKGWYWYDNVKERIPLVGVCDGDLTLFQFETSKQRDSVARFISKSGEYPQYWKILNEIKSKNNFLEKFVILRNEGAEKSSWTNHKNELSVELYESDLQVRKIVETLEVVNGDEVYTADMSQFTQYDRSFKLEEFRVEGYQIRILVSFYYGSRGHVQTRCGAGEEKGFILLTFTSDMDDLQSIQREMVESCNDGIYTTKEWSEGRTEFYDIGVEEDANRRLVIDRERVTMLSE